MCGLQRSVQPSRQVTSSPSAQAVEVASSAALIARRWHRGGRTGAASNTVCSTIALENPAELARRDTIGTLATLTIDIIILFSLRHCYGGAPRGERPASWDAPRPLVRMSRLTNATTEQVRLSALRPPLDGVDAKRKRQPRRRMRRGERTTLRCLTLLVETTANGSFARPATSRACVPGERSDLGPTRQIAASNHIVASRVVALGPCVWEVCHDGVGGKPLGPWRLTP